MYYRDYSSVAISLLAFAAGRSSKKCFFGNMTIVILNQKNNNKYMESKTNIEIKFCRSLIEIIFPR
jgi:hypothetical protein